MWQPNIPTYQSVSSVAGPQCANLSLAVHAISPNLEIPKPDFLWCFFACMVSETELQYQDQWRHTIPHGSKFQNKSQPDSAYSDKNENFQIVLSNGVEHLKPWMARPLETKQLGWFSQFPCAICLIERTIQILSTSACKHAIYICWNL